MNFLFAQVAEPPVAHDLWWHLGNRFREGAQPLSWLEISVGVAAVLVAGAAVWALAAYFKRRERTSYHNPKALFHDLCHVHALSSAQQRLLWQLAKRRFPNAPALVFLSPESFHVEAIAQAAPQTHAMLVEILDKVFAKTAP
ncbi:MAG: hypothetical protein KDA41_19020 [Planctomycetales bacterium]|nr:hypothetical protein [Planctomycetales bacterium]